MSNIVQFPTRHLSQPSEILELLESASDICSDCIVIGYDRLGNISIHGTTETTQDTLNILLHAMETIDKQGLGRL